MKYLVSLLVLSCSLILFTGCGDDDDQNGTTGLRINFFAEYDGQPLVWNEWLDYSDGQKIAFSKSEFFITDLQLAKENVGTTLTDVELVSFLENNSTLAGAQEGVTLAYDFAEVPEDNYTQLIMNIGLTPDQNEKTPSDFNSSSPLSKNEFYWQNWKSYIFSKLEGRIDIDANMVSDTSFVYHSGKDDLRQTIAVPINLDYKKGQINTINLVIDHKKFFVDGAGKYLDVYSKPRAHNANDLAYPTVIMSNFANATSSR